MTTEAELKRLNEAHDRVVDLAIAKLREANPSLDLSNIDRSNIAVSEVDLVRELTKKQDTSGNFLYLDDKAVQQEIAQIKKRQREEEEVRDGIISQIGNGTITLEGVTFNVVGGRIKVSEIDVSKTGGFALVDIDALAAKDGDYAALVAEYRKPLTGSYRERFAQMGLRFSADNRIFHEWGINGGPIAELSRCANLAWCTAYNQMEDGRILGGQGLNLKEFRAVIGIKSFAEDHNAYHPNGSGGEPKVGDLIIMDGHIARCVGKDGKKLKLVSGNHGDKVTCYSIQMGEHPMRGWVSMDEVLLEKARRGEAAIGPDGKAILSLDQVPSGDDSVPQEWMKRVFSPENAANVAFERAYAQMLVTQGDVAPGLKVTRVDMAAVGNLPALKAKLDEILEMDGKPGITIDDARKYGDQLKAKGIGLEEYGGEIDTLTKFITAFNKNGRVADRAN